MKIGQGKVIAALRHLCLLCLIFIGISACGSGEQDSPEQRVRATVEAIEAAAEERSLSGVMEHISESYQDHQGNSRDDLQRLVQFMIIRNQQINVFSLIRSIDVTDGMASVEVSSALSAQEIDLTDESNRLRADTQRFSLVLTDEDGRWRVVSASWQPGW